MAVETGGHSGRRHKDIDPEILCGVQEDRSWRPLKVKVVDTLLVTNIGVGF